MAPSFNLQLYNMIYQKIRLYIVGLININNMEHVLIIAVNVQNYKIQRKEGQEKRQRKL